MSKTFVASYNGQIVGKRTSKHRDYTHAVVVVDVPGRHKDEYYAEVKDTPENRRSFDYYVSIVNGTYEYMHFVPQDDVTRAQFIVSAGYAAFLVYLRDRNIAQYQRWQAALKLEPHVFGWSMSEKGARTMANEAERRGKRVVHIVPAELKVNA